MDIEKFCTRSNIININSIDNFLNVKGGINQNCKDVYFIRMLGVSNSLESDIGKIDRALCERRGKDSGIFIRIQELPRLNSSDLSRFYSDQYDVWKLGNAITLKCSQSDNGIGCILSKECNKVMDLFEKYTPNVNDSIKKNLFVKLMYWYDEVVSISECKSKNSGKVVISNVKTKYEYFFAYLLTLTGVDVLLLQINQDIDPALDKFHLSYSVRLGEFGKVGIPQFTYTKPVERTDIRPIVREKTTIKEPQHKADNQKKELEFEELALFAESVVMITIHNEKGEVIGSGSGIMIGQEGFILTNNHVASGGAVLNMQGELIGISTAGIDSGQNINLAVGYEEIGKFARGFIK